jgi:hypothetical protein
MFSINHDCARGHPLMSHQVLWGIAGPDVVHVFSLDSSLAPLPGALAVRLLLATDFARLLPALMSFAWLATVGILFVGLRVTPPTRLPTSVATWVAAVVQGPTNDPRPARWLLAWVAYAAVGPWFVGTFLTNRYGVLWLGQIWLLDGTARVLRYEADVGFFMLKRWVMGPGCVLVWWTFSAIVETRVAAVTTPDPLSRRGRWSLLAPAPLLWAAFGGLTTTLWVVGVEGHMVRVWARNYSWWSVALSPGVYWFTLLGALLLLHRTWATWGMWRAHQALVTPPAP